MSNSWQTVSVFISSTFNDMHSERDYLVKRVFPELREWCEKRKLRLVDIDLRCGVTNEDATRHKNVVKVCLDRIDECEHKVISLFFYQIKEGGTCEHFSTN
jgi:nephrocystin-3